MRRWQRHGRKMVSRLNDRAVLLFTLPSLPAAPVKRCVHNRRDAKSTRDSMRVPDAFSQGLAAPHKDGVSLVDLSRTRMELGHSNRTSA